MIGYYVMPMLYVAADLAWKPETVENGFEELLGNGFIYYDTDSEVVLINNFLKYNPFDNPNQITGAIKSLDLVPVSELDSIFFYRLMYYKESMCKGKKEEFSTLYQTLIETVEQRVSSTVTVSKASAEEKTEIFFDGGGEAANETNEDVANSLWLEFYNRLPNKAESNILTGFIQRYPLGLVRIALENTAQENKGMNYFMGIFANFFQRGIKTEEDYWDYEVQRDEKRGKF